MTPSRRSSDLIVAVTWSSVVVGMCGLTAGTFLLSGVAWALIVGGVALLTMALIMVATRL
jgi:hypothetical protein